MRKFFILSVCMFLCGALTLNAQEPYKHSIGGGIGFVSGITGASYKTFPKDEFGIQVDLGYKPASLFRYNSGVVQCNLMYQAQVGKKGNLGIMVGGGVLLGVTCDINASFNSLSFQTGYYRQTGLITNEDRAKIAKHYDAAIGFNTIFGLEYTFKKVPLTLQWDTRPGLLFLTKCEHIHPLETRFDYNVCNFSIRYIIK